MLQISNAKKRILFDIRDVSPVFFITLRQYKCIFMEKHILGLDIGTNSIGWSVVGTEKAETEDFLLPNARLLLAGSRIIPMDADTLGKFCKGNTQSQTKERTRLRGVRRLIERFRLRRERLNRVLTLMGFLPEHYAESLDRHGKFPEGEEPRIAWVKGSDGKWQFLFKEAFEEMIAEFRQVHPQMSAVPYDWTLYYLRRKALTQPVGKAELAWILHSFNQKRGYCQVRGEETEKEQAAGKEEKYYALRVESVEDSGDRTKGKTWYDVRLENGFVYHYPAERKPEWEGKIREFIVTTAFDSNGMPKLKKNGEIDRSFRMPNDDDWTLQKVRTEELIDQSCKTLGSYIYEILLADPSQKVLGQLVRTVERRFYREELQKILLKQQEYHAELRDRGLYETCIFSLYPNNEGRRRDLANRDFVHLLVEDILLYQRPLKSKKSLIADCPYEYHIYKDKETGEECRAPLKCIARSHPLFQEFRLRQFISNLRIFRREAMENGQMVFNKDVTADFFSDDVAYEELYKWLSVQEKVTQKALLKHIKAKECDYRWNYVEDKSYPAGETRFLLYKYLKKAGLGTELLTTALEERLWHLLYSVSDCRQLYKGLRKLAVMQGWPDAETFAKVFVKFPPFPSAYGSYSVKAIRKLLSLMRRGESWKEENIPAEIRQRINRLLTGEWDEGISSRVREKTMCFTEVRHFQGLPVWLACYVVYDRHSEAGETPKWTSPADIDAYLRDFRQHSLRNPIVEQVLTETLRTVRDIWQSVGHIDEIHVEMGREMKRTAKEREQDSKRMLENENTNQRIKALLLEFLNPQYEVEGVRPYSPSQQDKLRIYEGQAIENASRDELDEYGPIIRRLSEADVEKRPTASEVMRYKLWLEQKYCSPYTGQNIPLAKLFTSAYQIEHVIPQSRFFDDSQSNKVICEAEVNKLKDNLLGMEFIKSHGGEIVTCTGGRQVRIFSSAEYDEFVKEHYGKNQTKRRKLLMENIPEAFSSRQLNDTRYVSRAVLAPLSHIVRQQEKNGVYEQTLVSKNVVVCNGQVTECLKRDWGLGDVWNRMIAPRFRRLNEQDKSERFGREEIMEGKRFFRIALPLELQKGFSRKRIDHRHHAMDAIVIACATRNVVNYLNNQSGSDDERFTRQDLKHRLCRKTRIDADGNYRWLVKKPWSTFTEDTYATLREIVVSFKQNLRIINRCTNRFCCFDSAKGRMDTKVQTRGDRLAIRKSLHKDTVFGLVNLRSVDTVSLSKALDRPQRIVDKRIKAKIFELRRMRYDKKLIEKYFRENHDTLYGDINLKKIEVYRFSSDTENKRMVATRKTLDTSFDKKKIMSVTDTGIQKILLCHLEKSGGRPEDAFSPEGIEDMNANIRQLNGGRSHQPIRRVRVSEMEGSKFIVGIRGNRSAKYVEAAKGTNLFFAVYRKQDGSRAFATIPLNEVVERLKQGLGVAPEKDGVGNQLLFVISPNDLVYLPTEEERELPIDVERMDKDRIYKMVSSSGAQCFFIPYNVSKPIVDKYEYGSLNKMERAVTGEMVKEYCVPLQVDRIGRVRLK